MTVTNLTCIECPMGCSIEVRTENGAVVSVKGNTCPRGKMYAESEVVCPRRVVTSTVRTAEGVMVAVKTSRTVKKSEIFSVIKKINAVHPRLPVKIGDVILKDVAGGADLVATSNAK